MTTRNSPPKILRIVTIYSPSFWVLFLSETQMEKLSRIRKLTKLPKWQSMTIKLIHMINVLYSTSREVIWQLCARNKAEFKGIVQLKIKIVIIYSLSCHSKPTRLSFILKNEDIFNETWQISVPPLNVYWPKALSFKKFLKWS